MASLKCSSVLLHFLFTNVFISQSVMMFTMGSPLSLVSCVIYTSQDRAQTTSLFSVCFLVLFFAAPLAPLSL